MRRFILVLGAVLVLVVGAGALFLLAYSPEAQRAQIETELEAAFGRPVEVGPMRLTLAGGLGVSAQNLRVPHDPSFGEGAMLEVEHVRVDVDVWEFLVGQRFVVEDLVLEQPRFVFVKRGDGVWNWSNLGAGAPTRAATGHGFGAHPLAAAFGGMALAGDADLSPERIHAESAEVVVIDRTVNPPVETVYKGLGFSADVATEADGYRVRGRFAGDSAAAGGEPLSLDMPFDILLMPPSEAPAWRAAGTITTGRVATRNLKIDSVTTEVRLDEAQVLHLGNVNTSLYGGTMKGRASIELGTPLNRFALEGRFERISLADAMAARPDLAESLSGQLTADFNGTGELGDFNWTIGSLVGDGQVVLEQARLSSVNLLAEIARQGGFQSISFEEPGTQADRIEAKVRFGRGTLSFQSVAVTGINGYANLHAESGKIELGDPARIEMTGKATVLPRLFEKVRQQDPAAAAILSALRPGANITVPLTVSGPIKDPTVSVGWAAALGGTFPF